MDTSILIIVTSTSTMTSGDKTGVWLEEYAVPYMKFKKEGYALTVASIKGGKVPIDPTSLETKKDEWQEAIAALENVDKLSNIVPDKFQAVYVPGGHGAMFDLSDNSLLKETIAAFANTDKIVAAVCHGPAALVDVKLANGKYLVEGKNVTAFTNSEEDEVQKSAKMPFMLESKLKEQGALFKAKPNWENHVVVDNRLITGQNPFASDSIAQAIIRAIEE